MIRSDDDIIEIRELEDALFDRATLSEEEGIMLHERYRTILDIDFPSPKTGGRWRLRSRGWVGTIPIAPGRRLALQPKVELGNLFRMLEYAYRLDQFRILDGLIECRSLPELYERLVHIFAKRVLDRARRGLYRSYVAESDRLPYLRGALDVAEQARAPWRPTLHCHFEEHTADVEENRILAWTLFTIARQGLRSPEITQLVRAAYRAVAGVSTPTPAAPRDCIGRLYNRLNNDYQPLHALCRFFLEHAGPSHEHGDHAMMPFLVDMARLYELFVAEWLRRHLPDDLRLVAQERVSLDEGGTLSANIDLVIYDRTGETPRFVLDTKYKTPDAPAPRDRDQIVAYAAAKRCTTAVLVYPVPLPHPFNARFGSSDIHVRTLHFALADDLEKNGGRFLEALLAK